MASAGVPTSDATTTPTVANTPDAATPTDWRTRLFELFEKQQREIQELLFSLNPVQSAEVVHWQREYSKLQAKNAILEHELSVLKEQLEIVLASARTQQVQQAQQHQDQLKQLANQSNRPVAYGPSLREMIDAALRLQRWYRRVRSQHRWHNLVKQYSHLPCAVPIKQRNAVAREVLTSEETYVRSLNVIIAKFMIPLESDLVSGVQMSKAEIKDLFSPVLFDIFNVNQPLLRELEVQHEHWPSKPYQIGPLLNKAVSTFKCYSDYAANWPKSLMVLGRWRQKAPFVEWLASLRDDPVVGRQSIDDLLALPFDRISRYASMLDDLLRLTEDDHPEYDGLALALSKMKAFAESFYDLKRKFEYMALVYQTQTKIANAPNLVKPHRRLIREGELMELLTNEFGARSGALRTVYLFSDLLLVAMPDKAKSCKTLLPLHGASIHQDVEGPPEYLIGFSVHSGSHKVTLEFSTKELKESWLKDISTEIARLTDSERVFPYKSSVIQKRMNISHRWCRRTCFVESGLFHVVSESTGISSVILPLAECSISVSEKPVFGQSFAFSLRHPNEHTPPLVLTTKTPNELREWIQFLQLARKQALSMPQLSSIGSQPVSFLSAAPPSTVAAIAAANGPSASKPATATATPATNGTTSNGSTPATGSTTSLPGSASSTASATAASAPVVVTPAAAASTVGAPASSALPTSASTPATVEASSAEHTKRDAEPATAAVQPATAATGAGTVFNTAPESTGTLYRAHVSLPPKSATVAPTSAAAAPKTSTAASASAATAAAAPKTSTVAPASAATTAVKQSPSATPLVAPAAVSSAAATATPASGSAANGGTGKTTNAASSTPAAQAAASATPSNNGGSKDVWVEYTTDSGIPYYYNAVTKESRWLKPT